MPFLHLFTCLYRCCAFFLSGVRFHQGPFHASDGDRSLPADGHALSAGDTLAVIDMPHVHLTVPDAGSAMRALHPIHPYAYKTEPVEEAVEGAQRAEKTAEGPVTENAGKNDDDQDHKLPGKQDAQLREHPAV